MRTMGLACVLMVGGCFNAGGSGGGGAMQLSLSNCNNCSLRDPLASGGARLALHVEGSFASVRGSDPAVATFTVDTTTGKDIDVVTGRAGAVTLELLDARGNVITTAPFVVEDAAELKVDTGWKTAEPIVIADQPFVFYVTARDAAGRELRGHGEVGYTLGGTLAPSEIVVGYGDAIGFVGSAGTGTLTYGAPGVAPRTQSFQVVTRADLTGLTASAFATAPSSGVAVVGIDAESAQGGVYTDACVWTASDPSVTLQAAVGPSLTLGPGELGIFNLTRPGTFTVTCSAAGRSASVMISR